MTDTQELQPEVQTVIDSADTVTPNVAEEYLAKQAQWAKDIQANIDNLLKQQEAAQTKYREAYEKYTTEMNKLSFGIRKDEIETTQYVAYTEGQIFILTQLLKQYQASLATFAN